MKEFYTNNSRNLHIPIKTGKLTKKQKRALKAEQDGSG